MNASRQRRVLYREFLFRIADRELLSAYSSGDASRLLLQILTLLLGFGAVFSIPALIARVSQPQAELIFSWGVEHFLIATTMLTAGVFAVLGWGALFPDQRDVLVLLPLPVRTRTILTAKMAAVGTALAGSVLALHAVSGLAWPLRLNGSGAFTIPALTSDPAQPPVDAAGLQSVLDRALAPATRAGALAPATGGGVVVGVSTRGTRRVLAYGAAAADSVFPIASVTKVFTGLALAHLIEQGVVKGTEPIRALIPDAGLAPPARGRPDITPFDLVTHRSGLPGMPRDVQPRDPANPFADFDIPALYAFLSRRGVARPLGAPFEYSNVGFGLLGHAIAVRAGMDYETLVRRLVTEPLAMPDTGITLTDDQRRRLMAGHDRQHLPTPAWDVGAGVQGAGALMSTAPDLLTWLDASLHPERLPGGVLASAIRRSHERLTTVGDGNGVAYGWFLSSSGELGHSGDIAGFSAQVWLRPTTDTALVVLANTERGTSASADVIAEHVRARLDGRPPMALEDLTIPGRGGVRGGTRLFAAYWLTMLASGLFVFGIAAGLQGLAAGLLPRHLFLRLSPLLQLGVFCAVVGGYFLQPMIVTPAALAEAQQTPWAMSSPTLWFLGLFQALSGSPALAPLATRAIMALAVAIVVAFAALALAYFRVLPRMAEEPDLVPAIRTGQHLPRAGGALPTALLHFTARTLFRSAAHRALFTFYLGLGVALAAVLLKTPRAQAVTDDSLFGAAHDASVALIVSSVVMMVCAVVGARLTFALPRDLAANWIFRVLPLPGGAPYVTARRRTFAVVAAGPVWALTAAVLLTQWPWRAASAHLLVLALLAAILVEACLWGTQRIPFTCSYLPGRSHAHVTFPLGVILLLILTLTGADLERETFAHATGFAILIAVLAAIWGGARWWTWQRHAGAQPEFEDAPADRLVAVELWDVRP